MRGVGTDVGFATKGVDKFVIPCIVGARSKTLTNEYYNANDSR